MTTTETTATTPDTSADPMVVLGRIGEPYGVRGWVRLFAYGDNPEDWAGADSWWLAHEANASDWQEHGILDCKWHGEGLVALLDGVKDRTAAEKLKGILVALPRSLMPPTEDDEYYWGDLIGLTVINSAGETLGQVKNLIETGANDVMEVVATQPADTDSKPETITRLLPFVGSVVLEVDLAAGTIRVEWGLDW
jgi:16S rRNA processing protein RimM